MSREKMQELNKCPRCGHVLISHETVHALNGELYCSRDCAIRDTADMLIKADSNMKHNAAIEAAKVIYSNEAEVVATEDVLSEDFQEVRISVTFTKIIKLPKDLSEEKAREVAEHLWNESLVAPDYDNHDEMRFECELVKN